MPPSIYHEAELRRHRARQKKGICGICGLRPLVTTRRCQVCRARHNKACAASARRRRARDARAHAPQPRDTRGHFVPIVSKETPTRTALPTVQTVAERAKPSRNPEGHSLEERVQALLDARGAKVPGVSRFEIRASIIRVYLVRPEAEYTIIELSTLVRGSRSRVSHIVSELIQEGILHRSRPQVYTSGREFGTIERAR